MRTQLRIALVALAFLFVQTSGYTQTPDLIGTVISGTPQDVQAAIDSGAKVNVQDDTGTTPLIAAAQYNQAAIPILLRAGADVNAHETQRGETALSVVAYYGGTPELVTTLLGAGANIKAQDNFGDTALMAAVMYNPNPEVVKTLLKASADINAQDKSGMTPLMWAAKSSNSNVVLIFPV